MKNQKNFTEEDLKAVYAALVAFQEELAGMRKKVEHICAQAPALDGIVYKLGRGKTRATQTTPQAQ